MISRFLPAALRARTERRRAPDHGALLDRLPPVEHRPPPDQDQLLEQASLARALLLLVRVDQEAEYRLCRDLAEHALGAVPEPGE
ncbi:hypothetical protein [Streptomyces geranii]|uniref:hypothetical protein n=1 Tax=Streptomyces geranii TaxID=2058923 RepID=UPI000D0393AB|nr:hypothetical protein [Streptomyces geranii]